MPVARAPEPAGTIPDGASPGGQDEAVDTRHIVRRSYEQYHRRLEAGDLARHTRFMNFGYASLDGVPDHNRLAIPRLLPNAEGARLVGEILGDVPVADRVVVDVGCGRGGALWLVTRDGSPRAALGLDLSEAGARAAAATLAGRLHTTAGVGDAEALPVVSRGVDVLLNVESSLHYPHLERFHAEAARVLRTGGWFCYGDLFHVAAGDAYATSLTTAGFTVEIERDVTDNVLAARRARAERQRRALDSGGRTDASRFVAEPGTPFFDAMADGVLAYRLLRARRTAEPARIPDPDARLRTAADLAQALTGEFDAAT